MSIRDEWIVWHLGCGELPRYSSNDEEIYFFDQNKQVTSVIKDEFICPIFDFSGLFDTGTTADQIAEFFQIREKESMDKLVAKAIEAHPKKQKTFKSIYLCDKTQCHPKLMERSQHGKKYPCLST